MEGYAQLYLGVRIIDFYIITLFICSIFNMLILYQEKSYCDVKQRYMFSFVFNLGFF